MSVRLCNHNVISRLLQAKVGRYAFRLNLVRFHLIVGLLWRFSHVGHYDISFSHAFPRQSTTLQSLHDVLFVRRIELRRFPCGEKWPALLIPLKVKGNYLFYICHTLRWPFYRLKTLLAQVDVSVNFFPIILTIEFANGVLFWVHWCVHTVVLNVKVCRAGVLYKMIFIKGHDLFVDGWRKLLPVLDMMLLQGRFTQWNSL